ncbi:glycosyltransferase family 2 protein [Paenibacillus piri]|uniref:glycosyltransferase family 2 protein n=1 Tax=Paenibacillus piri TaxID=2547395 RepID=UPI001C6FF85B
MISVIIPTYKRTNDLHRCLQAILNQSRMPDEVIVIARDSDEATLSLLSREYAGHDWITVIRTAVPGVVAALNAGLEAARGDLIAITDDDTAPQCSWLRNIEEHFRNDPELGGVGGRDWVHHHGRMETGSKRTVGKVQWFGRVIGNHHLGIGEAREVDVLKGANMSYRRSAIGSIRFETCLKGSGAQVYNDMDFSMAVKKAGWKLLYDPRVAVNHYPAPRFDEDQRNTFNTVAFFNMVHNETYVLLRNLGTLKRIFYLIWAVAVGSTSSPGFFQWLRLLPASGHTANRKWLISMRGRVEGIRTWRTLSKGESR